jgi:myo-inositol-1(or 4)-monophosphatase
MAAEISDAEVAIEAAWAGMLVVSGAFGRDLARHGKDGDDFATDADVLAEESIRAVLREKRPDDRVIGEELGDNGHSGERTWLVDPLCGTRNFASMTGPFCVNVALREREDVQVVAVGEPSTGRVLWTDGALAYERRDGRDRRVRASRVTRLIEFNADGASDDIGPRLISDALVRSWMSPRVSASTMALAWVATGQRAAYASDGDLRHSVHFAAGIALCRAAGCIVSDLSGDDIRSGDGLLIAADRQTWTELHAHVDRHRGSR